ncbi:MAG: hypothetical protein RR145_03445, partial [Oscillospiraceae bacterium]
MVKKRIIPIMLCMCVLITCVNTGVFATNESLFSAWKPWSFYATSGNDAESLEGAGYGDVTNSEYYLPVVPQYVSSNSVQAGVLVTPEKDGRSRFYIRPEYEWDVKISEDLKERATFYLDSNDRVKSGKGQIVVGFTVPEDGTYNIYGNFVNAGGNDYLTEKETLGDGGFARISILPKGENLETKDNTNEVKIPVASEGKWKEEIYEKDNNDLKKGDRIFLRVSSGDNGIGDVFQVVYRISSIASDGKVLSTYDIRDLVDKQENSDIADNVQTVIDSSYIPKTEQSEEISEHAVALSVYGVIAESDVGNYSLEKNITRDEFAYLVGTIIGSGINSPKAKSEYFSDVDDTCNGFYIDALLHSGIISPSVTFDPRGNVAYKDALKMLVCATGYGIKAEEKGGYPHGYLKVANE